MILEKFLIVGLRSEVPEAARAFGRLRDDADIEFVALAGDGADNMEIVLRYPGVVLDFPGGQGAVAVGGEVARKGDMVVEGADVPR